MKDIRLDIDEEITIIRLSRITFLIECKEYTVRNMDGESYFCELRNSKEELFFFLPGDGNPTTLVLKGWNLPITANASVLYLNGRGNFNLLGKSIIEVKILIDTLRAGEIDDYFKESLYFTPLKELFRKAAPVYPELHTKSLANNFNRN